MFFFFFSSRRRHTRWPRDWSSDVSAFQSSARLGSRFVISATARSGYTLDELQHTIDEELERLKHEEPAEREVQRLVNGYETRFYEGLASVLSRAAQLATYHVHN